MVETQFQEKKYKCLEVTMERSISTKFWAHISWKRGLYIKALVLTLHNKMEWQKGKK